jgi:hypothetical protein
MAMKNIQTVAMCVAEVGVRVTGTGSEMAGMQPAPLSLPRQALIGYPIPAMPDVVLADNAAAARAVTRVGRSVSVSARLARLASGTVLSKRSPAMFREHRERPAMCLSWSKPARG